MRSALVSVLLLTACGTLSNEDLAYLEAIPQQGTLHVQVPQPAGQPLCGPGTYGDADSWKHAKDTGDQLNAGVDGLISLVEVIRTTPPTQRGVDDRTWGPFPDDKHQGVQIRVRMNRELDATGAPWRYLYVFEAKRSADYLTILNGEFYGAVAKGGIGKLTLHFENTAALAINNPNDPTGPMRVFYDLTGDPRTLSVDLTGTSGGSLVHFDYFWAGYSDGHGRFDFAFPSGNCTLSLSSTFTPQGAGKGGIHVECPLARGDLTQCWNTEACITYVDDPLGFTPACTTRPCVLGAPSACP